MARGYVCADGKSLNITGPEIDGLFDELWLEDITWMQVTEVAHEVDFDYSRFTSLRSLMISSLEPWTVPAAVCDLPLETLTCSGRALLPPEIGRLQSLKRMMVSGDCVSAMPDEITSLDRLRSLQVSWYGRPAPAPMPAWIAQMQGLRELSLYLAQFSAIDPALGGLEHLESLAILGALTHVTDFPHLTGLPSLKRLEVGGDGFSGLRMPSYTLLFSVLDGIADLATITSLDLSDWRSRKKADYLQAEGGRTIPDVFGRHPLLEVLDLSRMRIDVLPPSVFDLSRLRILKVTGNQIGESQLDRLREAGVECRM